MVFYRLLEEIVRKKKSCMDKDPAWHITSMSSKITHECYSGITDMDATKFFLIAFKTCFTEENLCMVLSKGKSPRMGRSQTPVGKQLLFLSN